MYDVFSLPDLISRKDFSGAAALPVIRSKATIFTATPGIRNRRINGTNPPGKPATTGGFFAKMRFWSLHWGIRLTATPLNGAVWNRRKGVSINRRLIITKR